MINVLVKAATVVASNITPAQAAMVKKAAVEQLSKLNDKLTEQLAKQSTPTSNPTAEAEPVPGPIYSDTVINSLLTLGYVEFKDGKWIDKLQGNEIIPGAPIQQNP